MNGKKFLAGILSAVMILGTMAFPVFAEETVQTISLNGDKSFQASRDEVTEYTGDTVTYEISGTVIADDTEKWINVLNPKAENVQEVKTVNFVGKGENAKLYMKRATPTIIAWQGHALNVNYTALTLSADPKYDNGDLGHMSNYFATELRCTNAKDCKVTYTDCTFENGSCNNQYGATAYNNCIFKNSNDAYYSLWVYTSVDSNGVSAGAVTVTGGTMEAARGVKAYTENAEGKALTDISLNEITIKTTNKPAVVASVAGTIRLSDVDTSACTKGTLYSDIQTNKGQKELAAIIENGKKVEYAAKANGQYFISLEDAKKNANEEDITEIIPVKWDTATDSGFYMNGDTKFGMMRFLFRAYPNGTVKKAGIRYIKTAEQDLTTDNAVTAETSKSAVQGDIIEIPVGNSNKYYAAAFIETTDGKITWSEPIECSVNWNKQFTEYNPGGAN